MIAEAMYKMDSLNKVDDNGCGATAKFVKVSEQWGLKFFKREDARDLAVDRQIRAAEHGLGPLVGDTITFNWQGDTWYGYMTEVCPNVLANVWADEEGTDRDDYRNSLYNGTGRNPEKWCDFAESEELADLKEGLSELVGWNWYDDHEGNVGYMADGRLVCIDFY